MTENINDFLSVVILLSVPVGLFVYLITKNIKKMQTKKKQKIGKYYPEW